MVKDKNNPLSHKEILNDTLSENHDIIKINGECRDQSFGSDALHANLDKHADDWETILTWPNGQLFAANQMFLKTHKKLMNIRELN